MGKVIGFLTFLSLMLISSTTVLAEYRAFELKISKKQDPAQFRLVISTLDPFQYAGYHIVREDELVQYTRTWICPGRTNDLPICPDPKLMAEQTEAEEAPSGVDGVRAPASESN